MHKFNFINKKTLSSILLGRLYNYFYGNFTDLTEILVDLFNDELNEQVHEQISWIEEYEFSFSSLRKYISNRHLKGKNQSNISINYSKTYISYIS